MSSTRAAHQQLIEDLPALFIKSVPAIVSSIIFLAPDVYDEVQSSTDKQINSQTDKQTNRQSEN